MENLIQGVVVSNFLDKTYGKDGKEYTRRYVSILDDSNTVFQFQIGWKCKNDSEIKPGQVMCAKWHITQFGNQEKKWTSAEIFDFEILSGNMQEQPAQTQPAQTQPVVEPDLREIYGVSLPIAPEIPASGLPQSDFDFNAPIGSETMPF